MTKEIIIRGYIQHSPLLQYEEDGREFVTFTLFHQNIYYDDKRGLISEPKVFRVRTYNTQARDLEALTSVEIHGEIVGEDVIEAKKTIPITAYEATHD